MNDMPKQLQLAAIISLLSSSALHGPSARKSAALCLHLDGLLRDDKGTLDPQLRSSLEKILVEWKIASHCQAPTSQAPELYETPHTSYFPLH